MNDREEVSYKTLEEDIIETILARNPREIRNKREFYLLYDRGLFGNKPLTWNSYEEIVESGWKGNVCIRGKRTLDRQLLPYNLLWIMSKKRFMNSKASGSAGLI